MNSWMKRWIPILSLAVLPIAEAQDTVALKTASEMTADTMRSTTETNQGDQQIQELKKQVDAIRSELAVEQISTPCGNISIRSRTRSGRSSGLRCSLVRGPGCDGRDELSVGSPSGVRAEAGWPDLQRETQRFHERRARPLVSPSSLRRTEVAPHVAG